MSLLFMFENHCNLNQNLVVENSSTKIIIKSNYNGDERMFLAKSESNQLSSLKYKLESSKSLL